LGAGASSSSAGTANTVAHFGHLIRAPAESGVLGLSVALHEGHVTVVEGIAAHFRRL